MLPEEAVLCSHYAPLCNGILSLTQGVGQDACCIMAACSCKSFNKWKLATMYRVLDNYNYFGYLKGANEVNRQYFQQAVLLCLLKALYLYFAGICSYAACIILCPNYAGIIRQGLSAFNWVWWLGSHAHLTSWWPSYALSLSLIYCLVWPTHIRTPSILQLHMATSRPSMYGRYHVYPPSGCGILYHI